MRLPALVLLLLPAAAAQSTDHALYFVLNAGGTTADLGAIASQPSSALGQLYDSSIARFAPAQDASAAKFTGLPEWAVLLGDCDGNNDFWESVFGSVDAIGLNILQGAPARLTSRDLILSTENAFGGAIDSAFIDGAGACDGTLFSLRRKPGGDGFLLDYFLREITVLVAIGQIGTSGDGVDVDAFALDADWNIYLSFRVDEPVNGTVLEDDGVVALPGAELAWDTEHRVTAANPGCAVIVLDAAHTNALVAHAGLKTASGGKIQSITDLQALEIDPAGGSFVPVQVSSTLPLAPNLLFAGQAVGPCILTTADGGRIATLDGHALGTPTLSGTALGLDALSTSGQSSDLDALLVAGAEPPCALVDVPKGEVDVHVPTNDAIVEFLAGGLTPLAPVLLLVDVVVPAGGASFHSVPVKPGLLYPDYFLESPPVLEVLFTDVRGRFDRPFLVGPPPMISFVALAQVADLVRHELTSPALVWCP